MAQTGEPYSVARKATQARAEGPVVHETPEDQPVIHQTPQQQPVVPRTPQQQPVVRETPEEQYVREAGEAGVPAAELYALRAVFLATDRVGQLRQAAEQGPARPSHPEPQSRPVPLSRPAPPPRTAPPPRPAPPRFP
jgi:hypothetical protein